jgi:predicted nucleic acid-binding protein
LATPFLRRRRGNVAIDDAWIAASAVLLRATLVHKDLEFEPVEIPQRRLPSK